MIVFFCLYIYVSNIKCGEMYDNSGISGSAFHIYAICAFSLCVISSVKNMVKHTELSQWRLFWKQIWWYDVNYMHIFT